MKLAVLPRYVDLKKENNPFNLKHCVNHDFELMAKKFEIGLCSVLSPFEFQDICDLCSGLIIPGSNNKVNPAYYGGEPMNPPPVYDEFALDLKVLDYFVKNNKPVFGICAGHQAINIYFGGTINYITEDGTKPHSGTKHCVNVDKNSFVYDAFKSEKISVNSYHVMHIDNLGKDLKVVCTSDDGIIEAIENREKRIFATQWHPEKCFENDNFAEMKLFENFIECCKN